MSRSASDATRFTATAPHAYSRTTSSTRSHAYSPASTTPGSGPPTNPSGGPAASETPAQKVARLRAAHAAKRASEISSWDRIVVRSRMIADSAHRWTVMGLIGLTVIAGGITVFSLGDMIMYNRRKRKQFYEEQHLLRKQRLMEAMAAEATGTADEEQLLLLRQERTASEFEEAKKKKKGWWKGLKGVFGLEGMKKNDVGAEPTDAHAEGDSLLPESSIAVSTTDEEGGFAAIDRATTVKLQSTPTGRSNILQAVEDQRRAGEKELLRRGMEGGQLDKLAEEASAAASSATSGTQKGWSGWFTRSS